MSEPSAVARLARLIALLSTRRSTCEDLCDMVTQVGHSGLYAVAGEVELVQRLNKQVGAASKLVVILGMEVGDTDVTAGLDELEKMLESPRWRHADEVRKRFESRFASLDKCAEELGAWVGNAEKHVDTLDRLIRRAEADGVPRKLLKVERDEAGRLNQLVHEADTAVKDGRLSAALAVRARVDPPVHETPVVDQLEVEGPPAGRTLAEVATLSAEVEEKAAAAEEMTLLAEVLLLRGVLSRGMREYTIVLRTPSAPGSHGVSIHDVIEVVDADHERAIRGVDKATGTVAWARGRRGLRDTAPTQEAPAPLAVTEPPLGPLAEPCDDQLADPLADEVGNPGSIRDLEAAREPSEAAVGPLREELVDLGDFLYRVFVPPFAQRLLGESVCPVSITTNDVGIPWELLHDGQNFLCLQRPLARMPSGQAIPRRLRRPPTRRRLKFLLTQANPIGDLREVKDEIRHIRDGLEEAWPGLIEVVEEQRPTGTFLNNALRHGEFDVIHFAGHAAFEERGPNEQARAGLVLFSEDDSGGDSKELFPASKVQRFVEGRPIVFLNACSTGRAHTQDDRRGVSYDAQPAEGLASAFLYGGALACIGSMWPVYDAAARHFAVEFYNAIIDRDSIGGAVLAARRATHAQFPNDPTWASFVLFGNPTFRLTMNVEASVSALRV